MKQNKDSKKTATRAKTGKDLAAAAARLGSLRETQKKSHHNSESGMTSADKWKITLVVVLLLLGLYGFEHYKLTDRWFAYGAPVLALIASAGILFYWCSFGRALVAYFKDATAELKKIVWPERKTAMRMTLLVLVFVLILALYLWLADSVLQWILYDLILGRRN